MLDHCFTSCRGGLADVGASQPLRSGDQQSSLSTALSRPYASPPTNSSPATLTRNWRRSPVPMARSREFDLDLARRWSNRFYRANSLASLMLYRIDQPSRDFACAFFQALYGTPPVSSTSHESGSHGRNSNLDVPDGGVRILALHALANGENGLAGLDDRKAFSDCCYHWPSRDRPPRWGVIREMDRCPRP